MNTFYVRLCGDLKGYCIVIGADTLQQANKYGKNTYGEVYGSVCSKRPKDKILTLVCI